MAATDSPVKLRKAIFFTAYSLICAAAHAADWKITPTINATETYSDNIALAPPGQTASGFITSLTPGVAVQGTSSRLKLNLNYALQDLTYDNYGWQSTYYNQLNASGTAELVKNTFFLDAGASINQQPMTLMGPISANGSNLSGNVANVQTETFSPYLIHQFGHLATAEARLTHINTNYNYAGSMAGNTSYTTGFGSTNMFSTNANTIDLNLKNGSAFNYLSWGLDYNNSTTAYSGFPTTTIALFTTNLGYLLTPRFKLTSQVGYENDNYVYVGPRPQSAFWNGGFAWSPSTRTKLEITDGERFYGRTYSFNFSHFTRMTAWNANYAQTVMTSVMQQSLPASATLDQLLQTQIPNPVTRQQTIQQMLTALGPQGALFGQNVITNMVFLSKTFQASVGMNTPKNIFLLTAFSTKSNPLQQSNSDMVLGSGYLNFGEMNQYGGTASWNHRLSPLLSTNFSGTSTRFTFPGQTLQENMNYILFGLSKKFNTQLFGNLNYRHQLMNSGLGGYNYGENAIIAGITYVFR